MLEFTSQNWSIHARIQCSGATEEAMFIPRHCNRLGAGSRSKGLWYLPRVCESDIVLYSALTKKMLLLELTVPNETRTEQHIFKTAKYEDLVVKLRRQGISARIMAVEVGAW
jgi:hypothetical protein